MVLISYHGYTQAVMATALLQRQQKFSLLYLWRNPHDLADEVRRPFALTVIVFRMFLVPTVLITLAYLSFVSYATFDFISEQLMAKI